MLIHGQVPGSTRPRRSFRHAPWFPCDDLWVQNSHPGVKVAVNVPAPSAGTPDDEERALRSAGLPLILEMGLQHISADQTTGSLPQPSFRGSKHIPKCNVPLNYPN